MFKLIPSTGNLYEVNRWGDIRRIVSYVNNQPKHKTGGVKKVGGTVLAPGRKANGYLHVALHLGGKQRSRYVHRLTAEAWFGEIPPKMVINHKDGDKTNNHTSNLEVVTQSENNRHAFASGLKRPTILKGEDNPRARTTEKEVCEIRRGYENGASIKEIIRKYPHLNRDIISSIIHRRTWKHIH